MTFTDFVQEIKIERLQDELEMQESPSEELIFPETKPIKSPKLSSRITSKNNSKIDKEKKKKKSIYHVTNAELLAAIRGYRETNDRKYYEQLGVMFFKIASKYTNHQKFINYNYMEKSDMIQNAVILMLSKIDNFDLDRDVSTNRSKISNPFAFYTQIATNSFKKDLGDDYKRKNMFQNVEFLENMEEGSWEMAMRGGERDD